MARYADETRTALHVSYQEGEVTAIDIFSTLTGRPSQSQQSRIVGRQNAQNNLMPQESSDHQSYHVTVDGRQYTRPQYNQMMVAQQRAEVAWQEQQRQIERDERVAERKMFGTTMEDIEALGQGRGDNSKYQALASFRWAYMRTNGNAQAALQASHDAYNRTEYDKAVQEAQNAEAARRQDWYEREIAARDAYARANTAENPFVGSNQSPVQISAPAISPPVGQARYGTFSSSGFREYTPAERDAVAQQLINQYTAPKPNWAQGQVEAFNKAIESPNNPYKSGSQEWWRFEQTRRDIDAALNTENSALFPNRKVYGSSKINDDGSVSFSWSSPAVEAVLQESKDKSRELAPGVFTVPGSLSVHSEKPPYSSLSSDISAASPILGRTLKGTPGGMLFSGINAVTDLFKQPEAQKGAKKAWSSLEKNPLIGDIYTGISSGLDILSKQEEYNKNAYEHPETASQKAYNSSVSKLIGDTSSYYTAGASKALRDFGTAYENKFVSSIRRQTKNDAAVGEFIVGISQTPEILSGLLDSGLYAGESLVRNPTKVPELLTAGAVVLAGSQAQGMYQQGKTNPAGLAGQLVGTYALFDVANIAAGKGYGVLKTAGDTHIPVEVPGYDAPYGYPMSSSLTEKGLKTSFKYGTLEPTPDYMKLATGEFTEKIPYVPGKGGRPYARLPNDIEPTDYTLYTAHESGSMSKGVKVGEAYKIAEAGHSELSGTSAAPVLESYYNKGISGGQGITIGWDYPKFPVSYVTKVSDLETIPASIKSQGWAAIDKYIQERAQPGGVAYIPLKKAEYEANIPMNSVFEVTGRNKYTKIGGIDLTKIKIKSFSPFKDKHFFGTRVGIVEQRLIGFDAPESGVVNEVLRNKKIYARGSGTSYKSSPTINKLSAYPSLAGSLLKNRDTVLGSSTYGKGKKSSINTSAYSSSRPSLHISRVLGTSYKSPSIYSSYGNSKSSRPTKGSSGSVSLGKSVLTLLSSGSSIGSYKSTGISGGSGSGRSGGGSGSGSGGGGSSGGSKGGGSGGSGGSWSSNGGHKITRSYLFGGSQYSGSGRRKKRKPKTIPHWEYAPSATPGEAWAFILGGAPQKKKKIQKKRKGEKK